MESQQDLIAIVEQASTLSERFANQFIPDTVIDSQLISSRWQTWCQSVAKGDLKKFAKRLVWDNVDSSAVSTLLGKVYFPESKQLPIWAEILQEVLHTDWETACINANHCLDAEKPIPFEELFLPFVYVARQKLISQITSSWELLSQSSQTSLERQLLVQLATLCASSLELEFSQFKALKLSTFTLCKKNINSNQHYQIFIQECKTNKLLPFFQKYSVLARLVGTAMNFWIEEKVEFLQRLASDLPIIQETFQENISQVVAIKANLSDAHNRGRSVIALTFNSGFKLIYKPRGLGLEAAYFQLLNWCNQQEILLPFKIVKVLDCATHGWMEYVEHLPCPDEEAAQRYYQRAGMTLCLLYLLQATDFHQENLIASSEHPVMVDLETLLSPEARDIDSNMEKMGGALYLATKQFSNSVLKTGLLPRWEFDSEGKAIDDSGLGGVEEQEVSVRFSKWQNINSDNMEVEYESGVMTTEANTVFLNGSILSPNDYVNQIVDGFQQMYQFLVQRREALLATDSPLAAYREQKVRFLFRNTQLYANVLEKAQQPKFLQHGVDYSIKLDVLSRAMLFVDDKPPVWSLLAVELEAMEQMDIPYFYASSTNDTLMSNSKLVAEEYFHQPSYDQMISRLQELSDADLAQQISIIRSSFYLRVARGISSVAATVDSTNLDLDVIIPLTQTELVEAAVKIAEELQRRAISAANGSTTWIGMDYNPEARRYQLQPVGYDLYDGVCGIAFFLAAVAKITGDVGFRGLALSALQDLRESLQDKGNPNFMKQGDIGAGVGNGSIIYTLVRISQFLNEPELLKLASLVASFITPERIASDRQFDLMSGAAGAILGLLSLYQASANQEILNQAVSCGYHLLINRTKSNSGFRAWANTEEKLATGLSHGAAGIAYALLRLYKITQEIVFKEAAEEAIAYERSLFVADVGNWVDEGETDMTSWCHGAPGIGLARLGGLSILDNPEIRQEIAVAINTTKNYGLPNLDHLCCGNFGRMEVLLVGACKLSLPELRDIVQKQAAWILARVNQVGNFYLFPEIESDIYNPAFFQGTAGIGYELLRLAHPELLPSVLLWD
jgi:type 2 lantibiotic biosynthesis protein LanM